MTHPVDSLISAAIATADRDLETAARPAFSGVVARARRIESTGTHRRWLIPTLAVAAAVLLAWALQQSFARPDAQPQQAFQAGAQPDPTPPQPLAPFAPTPQIAAPALPTPPRDAAISEPHPPRELLKDRLARLDDEAEVCMQTADLACAESRYSEIIDIGGRRVQVELAFADRFHLARQRHDPAAQRALWTAYLARFPRGQFADDARGGLCRLADESTRPACWHDYLADFPTGSFAAEAAPR